MIMAKTDWYIKNLSWIGMRDGMLYQNLKENMEPRPEADWSIIDGLMKPKEWVFGLGPIHPEGTVLMYGFGDGNHVVSVLDKLSERGHLIVVIPEVPEFLELMHQDDMEMLLSDRRLHLVVYGLNNEMLLRYIAICMRPEVLGRSKLVVLPDYEELYPEGITFLDQAFTMMIEWMSQSAK